MPVNQNIIASNMPSQNNIIAKPLVVYFSHAGENYSVGNVEVGNTELLAQEIISKTGADGFKIIPVNQYPEKYQQCIDVATSERNSGARPDYINDVDVSKYSTIFLGYPIWWGNMPMIMYSFLDKHNFVGKTIIPFNTHEGSGDAGTYKALQSYLPQAIIKTGLAVTGTAARTDEGLREVDAWLQQLGF